MLEEKIRQDLIVALKEGKKAEVSVLRFLLAEIRNESLAKQKQQLSDEEIIAVIRRQIKRHRESVEAYQRGSRSDLVNKEKEEINILSKYIPQEIKPQELEKIIQETIAELKASGPADFGKVMGAVMAKVKGRVEGSKVAQLVKETLNSKD